ncbi:MBL fold metallo-hydrolase [Tundrisphaera lichenicola]|uniref:MBL fold metallo-hydrolase n=1 Tax=Tundrisphaera lichenicola TaxID=2029860 RepID=UPI003EBF33C1
MKITLIPSSMSSDGVEQNQYLISYLINDCFAIDAGGLGFYGSPEQQSRVKHVLISHTHADHVASLPIFVENAFDTNPDCVTIHGSDVVLDCLQRDIFNGRIWPDFIGMSAAKIGPFLKLNQIEAGRPFDLPGVRITPIAVDHLVPTLGFLIEEGPTAVIVASDTGPTEELWKVARETPGLKAVFLEASFPNSMTELANLSKHLTPAMFGEEARKLGRDEVQLIVVHIKPRFRVQILAELEALGLPNLAIARFNETYTF